MRILDSALVAAAVNSHKYMSERRLPDKPGASPHHTFHGWGHDPTFAPTPGLTDWLKKFLVIGWAFEVPR